MLPRGEEDHPRRSRRRRPVFYDDDVEGCDAESCSSSHCSSPRRSSHHLPQHIPLDDYGPDQDEGRLFSFIYDLVYAVVHTALTACVNFLDSWRRRRRKRRRNSNTNLNIIEEENSRPRSFRPPDAGIDDIESGMVRGENPRHNYEPEWHNAPSASAPMTPPILKQPTYGPVYGHPADGNRRVRFPPPPNKHHLPLQGVTPSGYDAGLTRSRPPLGRIHSFGTASTCSVSTVSTSSSLGSSSTGSSSSTRSYRSSTSLPDEVHSYSGSHRSSRSSDHTASGRRNSDFGRHHCSSNDLLRRREGGHYEPRRKPRCEGSSRPSGQRTLALEPVFGHSKFAQGGARRNHGSMFLD